MALTCTVIFLLEIAYVGTAHAQSLFTLLPYRVEIYVVLPPEISEDAGLEEDFCAQLSARLTAEQGGQWRVSVGPPPAEERALLRAATHRDLEFSPSESWKKIAARDKVFVLAVRRTPYGWDVLARDWDVRVERLGPLVRKTTPTWAGLLDVAVEAIREAFIPVARIRMVEQEGIRLDLQGSLVASQEPTLPSRLFLPLARYEDRDGNARAVLPLAWTILVCPDGPPNVDGSITCEIVSGLRNPLSARRRGRVQLLAWALIPQPKATTLTLKSRQDAAKPLIGYEILAQDEGAGTPQFLGRTGFAGSFEVPPSEPPNWKTLWIRHGRRLLAKVPFVTGYSEFSELVLPDDDHRLVAEGYLMGVQDELVDLVTLRSILMARLRARISEGDWDEALQLRDRLLQLKSRETFSSELVQQQQRFYCPDPVGQKQIDKMFEETRRLVQVYLNPADLEKLVKELAMKAPRRSASPQQENPMGTP